MAQKGGRPTIHTTDERVNAMKEERQRLHSFKSTWPYEGSMSRQNMAKAGFYYSGISDKVLCPFCKISLDRWEKDDDPLKEHKMHSSPCCFITDPMKSGNIPMDCCYVPSFLDVTKHAGARSKNPEFDSYDPQAMATSQQPIDPGMQNATDRMMTFGTWPKTHAKQPYELCPAGFYWTMQDDTVRCFWCGGYVKGWCQVEDPWVEHARLHPCCEFVKNEKSQFFIDQVLNTLEVRQLKDKLTVYAQQQGFNKYDIDPVLNKLYISEKEMSEAVLNMSRHTHTTMSSTPDDGDD